MTEARIVTAFTAEIRAAKNWHQHAPRTILIACPQCSRGTRAMTRHRKSSWQVGIYTCEACGWRTVQTWKNY